MKCKDNKKSEKMRKNQIRLVLFFIAVFNKYR